MLHRRLAAFVVTLCTLSAAVPALAQAPIPPAVAADSARGPVRVLVRLRTVPAADRPLRGPAPDDLRDRIAAAQARVAVHLGPSANARRFSSIPWLAATVTRDELAALAADPSVTAIAADSLMAPASIDGAATIGAPVFWNYEYDGEGWAVAILDTGVDSHHPALGGRVLHQACFSTSAPAQGGSSLCPNGEATMIATGAAEPCPASVHGCEHGTAIAGVAAGHIGSFASGTAPAARIIAIQVYTRFDDGPTCGAYGLLAPCALSYTSNQIAALEHVLAIAGPDNAARIAAANLSLSGALHGAACDTAPNMVAFKAVVDDLRAAGIATVVATGNDGDVAQIGEPACVSSVVAVGATEGDADVISGESNRGAAFDNLVLTPGTGITSLLPGGAYATFNGTSIATAFVTGGWALLRHFLPAASVDSLLWSLRNTGVSIPDAGGAHYPRIDLVNAALVTNGGMPVPPDAPEDPHVVIAGNTATLLWTPPAAGNGATRYVVSAGSQPGAADLGVFNVTSGTAVSALVGVGNYWVRVRSENPAGASPDTADVAFSVAPPSPPDAPTLADAIVDGDSVTLSWEAASTGGSPASYVIEAGSGPGVTDIVRFETGGPGTSVLVTAVPLGTYYVRVRAQNSEGGSTVSNEIIVTVE